jgi:hypothetical protein
MSDDRFDPGSLVFWFMLAMIVGGVIIICLAAT